MTVTYVVEGAVDRAVVKALLGEDVEVLPQGDGQEATGREAAIVRAAAAAQRVGAQQIVLVLDWNAHSEADLGREVQGVLGRQWNRQDLAADAGWWKLTARQAVRLVPCGLPGNEALGALGVSRHMMDDYLLLLLLADCPLEAFCGGESHLAWTPPNAGGLRKVMEELAAVARGHDIPVDSSKRWMDLCRAAIGFQASRTVLAKELIVRCPQADRDVVLGEFGRALVEHPPL
jgi:hypothetical protein